MIFKEITYLKEMKDGDNAHYLVHMVFGITQQEGKLVDEYQNKTETIDCAIKLLLKACKSSKYMKKVIITRHNMQSSLLPDIKADSGLILFNGLDDFLQNKKRCF